MSAPSSALLSFSSADAVRFPDVCAQCGARPLNGYELVGRLARVRVPLCAVCDRRKTVGMTLYVVGALVGTLALVLLLSIFLEAVLPFPEEHDARATMGLVIALLLLTAAGATLFFSLRRRAALYHRFRSPVFIAGETEGVTLACRNASFAHATRALMDHAHAGYREPPRSTFVAPDLPGYFGPIAVILWGVGTVLAGIARYREVRMPHSEVATLLRSVEILAHAIAGAEGVLAVYLLASGLILASGAAWLRAVHRTRAEILSPRQ